MSILDEDLRTIIDSGVAPVTAAEVISRAGHRRRAVPWFPVHRTKLSAVLVGCVVVAVTALAVVLFANTNSSRNGSITVPANGGAGDRSASTSSPLRSIGRADCSDAANAGQSVVLAVTVTGGHDVCVVKGGTMTTANMDDRVIEGGTVTTVYVDDRLRMQGSGGLFGLNAGRILGRGRNFVLVNLDPRAAAVRLTACNGEELTVKPLLKKGPERFAAAAVTPSFQTFYTEQLDADGNPIPGPMAPGRAGMCNQR